MVPRIGLNPGNNPCTHNIAEQQPAALPSQSLVFVASTSMGAQHTGGDWMESSHAAGSVFEESTLLETIGQANNASKGPTMDVPNVGATTGQTGTAHRSPSVL